MFYGSKNIDYEVLLSIEPKKGTKKLQLVVVSNEPSKGQKNWNMLNKGPWKRPTGHFIVHINPNTLRDIGCHQIACELVSWRRFMAIVAEKKQKNTKNHQKCSFRATMRRDPGGFCHFYPQIWIPRGKIQWICFLKSKVTIRSPVWRYLVLPIARY